MIYDLVRSLFAGVSVLPLSHPLAFSKYLADHVIRLLNKTHDPRQRAQVVGEEGAALQQSLTVHPVVSMSEQ